MHKAALPFISMILFAGGIISCTPESEKIQLATGTIASGSSAEATQLYAKARDLESKGKINKAKKTYGKIAGSYPMSTEAPDSRIREANLYYSQGELINSFDKYQLFITQYSGTSQYDLAIKRQAEVAHAAATGKIKNKFIGLKSNIPRTRAERMLEQVRDNAPFGTTAPKAQFGIAEMWQNEKNFPKAIKAYEEVQLRYPKSSLAPEALFRVGSLLLKQTEDGNRNRGNLDTAETTFTDLTLLYPNTKQAREAKNILKTIKAADIERSFSIAEFYEKKKQYPSAAFYYKEVIARTKPGSDLYTRAKQKLAAISQ